MFAKAAAQAVGDEIAVIAKESVTNREQRIEAAV
jgi:hypothetical protein